MQRFYSPSQGGFFSEDVHGPRMIEIGDPSESVANPDCMVPEDAVPISNDLWRELLIATSHGSVIEMVDGAPVAVEAPTEGES